MEPSQITTQKRADLLSQAGFFVWVAIQADLEYPATASIEISVRNCTDRGRVGPHSRFDITSIPGGKRGFFSLFLDLRNWSW